MLYLREFEFYEGEGGYMVADPLTFDAEGTFGNDFDDRLMRGEKMLPMSFGREPRRGGRVLAITVRRELGDIPAMTAADAARALGVSPARADQLIKAGELDSWRDGTKRMVSEASVEARLEYADARVC